MASLTRPGPLAGPGPRLRLPPSMGPTRFGGRPSLSPAVLSAGSYYNATMALAPAAYWPMGEPSGNIADSSGNGNTGTANGGLTYGVAGGVGGSTGVTFDGATGFFQVADAASIRVIGDGTWESWIKPVDNTSNMAIMAKRSGSNAAPYDNLLVGGVGAGNMQLEVGNGTTNTLYRTNTNGYKGGTWQHLAVTRQGSTVTFFVNAVMVQAITTTPVTVSDAAQVLLIGSNVVASSTSRFNGSLQHVAIYNYALTANQIAYKYQAAFGLV